MIIIFVITLTEGPECLESDTQLYYTILYYTAKPLGDRQLQVCASISTHSYTPEND